jgi:hypothetical protein
VYIGLHYRTEKRPDFVMVPRLLALPQVVVAHLPDLIRAILLRSIAAIALHHGGHLTKIHRVKLPLHLVVDGEHHEGLLVVPLAEGPAWNYMEGQKLRYK